MPQKVWAINEEVQASDFNTYMQNQCVPQFTGTAQRDSQWPTPPAGALCVTTDTNTLWQRAGSVWRPPTVVDSNRQLLTLNGATVGTTETWLGSIIVPSFTYPHRVRFGVTCLFTMAAAGNLDFRVRYNTTGAAIALTDPLVRSNVVAANTGPCSMNLWGTIDRASGPTTVGVLALVSGGTAASASSATTAQLEVRVTPT